MPWRLVALILLGALEARAVQQRWPEGTARAFPVVLSADAAQRLGDVDYTQTVSGSVLTVKLRYSLADGRRIAEDMTFTQGDELSQRTWYWKEQRGERLLREFAGDLVKGVATAKVLEDGEYSTWEERFDPQPADTRPNTCADCAAWNAPRAPFRIFGNTSYVGVAGLSSVVIDTGAGLVLIDGALPQSAERIEANLRTLGYSLGDVRWILSERCADVVSGESLTAVSAMRFRYSKDPARVAQFRESIAKVRALPCDILVPTHPSADRGDAGLTKRLEDEAAGRAQ